MYIFRNVDNYMLTMHEYNLLISSNNLFQVGRKYNALIVSAMLHTVLKKKF